MPILCSQGQRLLQSAPSISQSVCLFISLSVYMSACLSYSVTSHLLEYVSDKVRNNYYMALLLDHLDAKAEIWSHLTLRESSGALLLLLFIAGMTYDCLSNSELPDYLTSSYTHYKMTKKNRSEMKGSLAEGRAYLTVQKAVQNSNHKALEQSKIIYYITGG